MISIPQSEYVCQHFEAPYSPCTPAIVSSFNSPSIAPSALCVCACAHTSEHMQRHGLVGKAPCALISVHIPVSQEVALHHAK